MISWLMLIYKLLNPGQMVSVDSWIMLVKKLVNKLVKLVNKLVVINQQTHTVAVTYQLQPSRSNHNQLSSRIKLLWFTMIIQDFNE